MARREGIGGNTHARIVSVFITGVTRVGVCGDVQLVFSLRKGFCPAWLVYPP